MREVPEFHLGPNSVTMASLVDCLVEAKRQIIRLPEPMTEYNSLTIVADELSAFMPMYDPPLIGGLTTFYDCVPYAEQRRHHRQGEKLEIMSPQLNILCGTTPSNLLKMVPDIAWEQGFMSRVIMIYSAERPLIDIFAKQNGDLPEEMIHDLRTISGLFGEFTWAESYAKSIHDWRTAGQSPAPKHPKLVHYNSRRLGHLLKLSMVSAIDRGNILRLEQSDFVRALEWLASAEALMPEIFSSGQGNTDSQAMDEIVAFINGHDLIGETQIVNFARRLNGVKAQNVMKIIEIMEKSGIIRAVKNDPKTGMRLFKAERGAPAGPTHG
ncbi:MAG: hypothetical protein LAO18_22240 [Acidobacteriia bacterium]|nr:hypothetical protein [Terriglobia bacterium]